MLARFLIRAERSDLARELPLKEAAYDKMEERKAKEAWKPGNPQTCDSSSSLTLRNYIFGELLMNVLPID